MLDTTCTDCNELVRWCRCGLFVSRDDRRINESNRGFWSRPADERAERMRDAAERGGVDNFFDLPPDERAQAYDDGQPAP